MQPEYNRTKREKYAKTDSYRQRIVEQVREHRKKHPEAVKASDKKYRVKHRQEAAARSRDWHEKNKARANTRRIVRKQAQRHAKPWTVMIHGASQRAKAAGIPFDLTYEWGAERWTGRCELTGLPFAIERGMGTKIWAASLDRIIPSLGYTQENCRFILFCLNAFKHNGSDDDMYKIAHALLTEKPLKSSVAV